MSSKPFELPLIEIIVNNPQTPHSRSVVRRTLDYQQHLCVSGNCLIEENLASNGTKEKRIWFIRFQQTALYTRFDCYKLTLRRPRV